MTQFQFDLICKIINAGAPALAEELCNSLGTLVQAYNNVVTENEKLKADLEKATSTDTKSEEQSSIAV